MKRKDFLQVVLNIIACLVLLAAPGGHGSFWGFLTFNIISSIILLEILLSKDTTAQWLWITKTVTYVLLCIKFSQIIGVVHWQYPVIIGISVCTLIVSRRFIRKRSVAMWGQNIAYVFGGYLYCIAILHYPDSFGIYHIVFWIINLFSFLLISLEIVAEKKERTHLIIPLWGICACIVYIAFIVAVQ